jgi:hypothetical protein
MRNLNKFGKAGKERSVSKGHILENEVINKLNINSID